MYVYACMYVCMYVCVCIYVCVYIYCMYVLFYLVFSVNCFLELFQVSRKCKLSIILKYTRSLV